MLTDNLLVSVSEDATCKIWDLQTKTCIETLKGHIGRNIYALAVKGDTLVTGGDDSSVKVWNANEILKSKSESSVNVYT